MQVMHERTNDRSVGEDERRRAVLVLSDNLVAQEQSKLADICVYRRQIVSALRFCRDTESLGAHSVPLLRVSALSYYTGILAMGRLHTW